MAKDKYDPYKPIGVPGVTRYGGTIAEEWLTDLSGVRGVRVYKEMRDNDPMVGAVLFALEMLMRQVEWRVDAASTEQKDLDAQMFLESCLFDMAASWQAVLSQIFSMLPFGWAFLELVYKKRTGPNVDDPASGSKYSDGKIGWQDWAIRSQDTLDKWQYDEESGKLSGMIQAAPPTYDLRTIPLVKALLFRVNAPKDNPEGRGVLRNAYRPWFIKKNIENIEAIGIERDLAGLPVVWLPKEVLDKKTQEATDAYNAYQELVTKVRRDEQEGIMMPLVYDEQGNKVYDITLLSTGSRRQFDTTQIINRYDQRIAMTVMAEFLLLGQQAVGSYALASSKTSLFSTALGAVLDALRDVINAQAVPRLFALNAFSGLEALPTVEHGDVETPDLGELGAYIKTLADSGATLFPDDDLENYLREVASLPDKPEVTAKQQAVATKAIQEVRRELRKIEYGD